MSIPSTWWEDRRMVHYCQSPPETLCPVTSRWWLKVGDICSKATGKYYKSGHFAFCFSEQPAHCGSSLEVIGGLAGDANSRSRHNTG